MRHRSLKGYCVLLAVLYYISGSAGLSPGNNSIAGGLRAAEQRRNIVFGGTIKTVTLNSSLVVAKGETLTILPGTVVKLAKRASLIVRGKMIARGTPSNRIIITSTKTLPAPGDWGSIYLTAGGPDTLSYCDIQYGTNGLWFDTTPNGSLIDHCRISYCANQGVVLESFHTDYPQAIIRYSRIFKNRKEGIFMSTSAAYLHATKVDSNGYGAIADGINLWNGSSLMMGWSRVQYNAGIGIEAAGLYSKVYLSPNGTDPGYNNVHHNYAAEIVVRGGGHAFFGENIPESGYWDCPRTTADQISAEPLEPCVWVPIPALVWGGLNNVFNDFTFEGRTLYNDITDRTIMAHRSYWGPSATCTPAPNSIIGPVSTLHSLCSWVSVPDSSDMRGGNTYVVSEIEQSHAFDTVRIIKYLQYLIGSNSEAAYRSLYRLADFTGQGKQFASLTGDLWESYLERLESTAQPEDFKSLVSAFRIQAKMNEGLFKEAAALANDIASRTSDDNLRTYCRLQNVVALRAEGNLQEAIAECNALESHGILTNPEAVKGLSTRLAAVVELAREAGDESVTPNEPAAALPAAYALFQNYPNPFNPVTHIQYRLPYDSRVTLSILNVLGQEIETLVDNTQTAGYKSVGFDGSKLSSGVYFYRIVASSADGGFTDVKKLVLVK